MAIIDAYVDQTDILTGTKVKPHVVGKGQPQMINRTFEVAAADDNASVYRLAPITSNRIPHDILIMSDAITSGTDWDLGFYQIGVGGAVVNKDLLVNGVDLSSASRTNDGMANVNIADIGKSIAVLLGLTDVTAAPEYDLALTANVVGSAAGTITVLGTFLGD